MPSNFTKFLRQSTALGSFATCPEVRGRVARVIAVHAPSAYVTDPVIATAGFGLMSAAAAALSGGLVLAPPPIAAQPIS
jgi:hypothetical protein